MDDRLDMLALAERCEGAGGTDEWFCERGNFWGTVNQLCLCARCGKNEHKRHDEPRHFANLFQPTLHQLCDECFDALPARAALTGETA